MPWVVVVNKQVMEENTVRKCCQRATITKKIKDTFIWNFSSAGGKTVFALTKIISEKKHFLLKKKYLFSEKEKIFFYQKVIFLQITPVRLCSHHRKCLKDNKHWQVQIYSWHQMWDNSESRKSIHLFEMFYVAKKVE